MWLIHGFRILWVLCCFWMFGVMIFEGNWVGAFICFALGVNSGRKLPWFDGNRG